MVSVLDPDDLGANPNMTITVIICAVPRLSIQVLWSTLHNEAQQSSEHDQGPPPTRSQRRGPPESTADPSSVPAQAPSSEPHGPLG